MIAVSINFYDSVLLIHVLATETCSFYIKPPFFSFYQSQHKLLKEVLPELRVSLVWQAEARTGCLFQPCLWPSK